MTFFKSFTLEMGITFMVSYFNTILSSKIQGSNFIFLKSCKDEYFYSGEDLSKADKADGDKWDKHVEIRERKYSCLIS